MMRLRTLALAAGLVFAAAPAQAQTIVAKVGGELAGTRYSYIQVPISLNLAGAPGRILGGYRARLQWNPNVLSLQNFGAGAFAQPVYQTDSLGNGILSFTAIQPVGATGDVLLAVPQFYVTDTLASAVSLTFQDLTASSASSPSAFEDLLPFLSVVNGTYCPSIGKWGDVDSDGRADSRDALAALSAVVGLPLGNGMNGALADVDGDAATTSRDALIILSYAVGLPVNGFRVLLNAAGPACATGAATSLTVRPDTIDLVPGQDVSVVADARDAQGRPVPASSLTWRTLDGLIAQVDASYGPVSITGYAPGIARIVATLGPGIADTLIVKVATRRTWIVDVQKAVGAPVQTGSPRHPFARIDDALGWARSNDTVMVRPGTYPEYFNQDIDVVLLGDSINKPIIDARGYQYWSPGSNHYLTPDAGNVEVAHLVFRAAGLYTSAQNVIVRDVVFDSAALDYRVLEVYGNSSGYGGGDLRAGSGSAPRRTSPTAPSSIRVTGVTVMGRSQYGQSILLRNSDTVEVANVAVLATQTSYYTGCYPGGNAQIEVLTVMKTWIHDNVVDGGLCNGISVEADQGGTARVERNRIRNMAGTGIVIDAAVIRSSHNVVRDMRNSYYSSEKSGIRIFDSNHMTDSVHSVGDSVINVAGAGLHVDSARALVVESLTVDGAGLDSTYAYEGQFLPGGLVVLSNNTRMLLRDNRITNVQGPYDVSRGYGIMLGGWNTHVTSRHNVINNTSGTGYAVFRSCYYYYGCYGQADSTAADSLISVGDTVITGGVTALQLQTVRSALVDSASLSAGTYGVYSYDTHRARVRNSGIRNAYTGLYFGTSDSVELRGNRIVSDSIGVSLQDVDSALIHGTVLDSNYYVGVENQSSSLRIDSSAVARSGIMGIIMQPQARITVRRTRFEDNLLAIWFRNVADSLTVRQSSFISNDSGAIQNDWGVANVVMADSNYWGSNLGPSCQPTSGTCAPGAGDSVLTPGVDFSNFLTAAPITGVSPMQRTALGIRPRVTARAASRFLARSTRPAPSAAALPVPPQAAPVPVPAPVRPARRAVIRHTYKTLQTP